MSELDATTAIKTLSIVGTGILGILGIAVSFRRDNGKLNRWGYVTVSLIGLSMFCSVFVTLMEANKEKVQAREQLERMEGLYREINRSIQPITHVSLAFSAALPMDNKSVKDYASYLDTIIRSRKNELRDSFPPVKGLSVRVLDHNGDINAIEIDQKSPYWPKKDSLLNRAAQKLWFEIYLRKDPIKPELLNPSPGAGSDLIVWPSGLTGPNNTVIWLDYPSKKLIIRGSGDSPKNIWYTNGRIASVQDLFGAQLLLRLPIGSEWLDNRQLYDLINSLDIRTMTFGLAPGRMFSISGAKFNKAKLSDGSLVFNIVLPTTDKELFFNEPLSLHSFE